jgi:hypothetical protein
VQVKLFAMSFVEDEPNFDEEDDEVFGGEKVGDAQFALLYYSPRLQLADYAEIDDSEHFHDADDENEVAFAGDGQSERPADFFHQLWVLEY